MSSLIKVVCPHCARSNRLPIERASERPDCGACAKPLFTGRPVQLNQEDFDDYLDRNALPVVVDFWAPWCGPCKAMAPQFEQAAAQMAGRMLFAKLDTEANPALAQRYSIRSIPTLAVFRSGKLSQQVAGARSAAQIIDWLRS